MPVAKSKSGNLKLFTGQPTPSRQPPPESIEGLAEVLRGFRRATGWSLRYAAGAAPSRPNDLTWSAPVNPGVGTTLGHLRLDPADPGEAGQTHEPVDEETAREMAATVAGMVDELLRTRHALWQREAELAAGVPLIPHREEEKHLAERLQAVLKGGAEAVDCQAAALYLLDDATTELKLRSSWGMPFERLTAPARQLQGAVADLEALLGHAVVLDDPKVLPHWNAPEKYASAVCVPVSSPTTLLGTMWVFCGRQRDFDDRQTNILEVVAGRVAADLEREMLMREGIDGARWKKQLALAERLQRSQLPSISPLLDGWDVCGSTFQEEAVGGDFHDWFCLPDGLLAIAVGDAMDRGLEAAMSANALKAALRAHAQYHRQAERMLPQLNLTLWTGSAGDQFASLFYGLIETSTGRVCYSTAGQAGVVVVRPDGWESLTRQSPQLGVSPESDYDSFGYELNPGEALAVFTDGVRDATDADGHVFGEAGVAESITARLDLPAEGLVSAVWQAHDAFAADANRDDRSVLVVKRSTP